MCIRDSIYTKVKEYLSLEKRHLNHEKIDPQEIVHINPNYYDSYRIAGDVYAKYRNIDSANWMYRKALTLEIATQEERKNIQLKIVQLNKKL